MKQIAIKTSTGVEVISAGAERYSELSGYKPVDTSYIDTTITLDENDELVVTAAPGHSWTEEELLWFCQRASDGRYDINSDKQGHEIILIDSSNAEIGRRYRRINVDYDEIWDSETGQWLTISDTTAKQLIVKFLNEDEIPSALVVGDPLVVKLYYYSNIGTGRITITMNDSVFSAGTVRSGDTVEIDLGSRIKDGANTISIKIANDATEKFIPEMVINGINLTYTPNFNQYQPFMDTVTFAYACAGSADKIVHFDIVNSHGEVSSIDSNRHGPGYTSASIILPSTCFSKGENYIHTYMYALNGSTEIARTITTTYKIPYLTDDEPLLMVYFENWNDLKQYGSINIPYYVWKRTSGNLDSISFSITSDAFQTVEYNYDTGDVGAVVNYLQYNNRHNWLISSLPSTFVDGIDKKATFRIVGTEADVFINEFIKTDVTIASSSSAMETVEGYLFNFAAKDLLTATDIWESRGPVPKTMLLEGFNWNTDGIKFDEDGTQVLHYGPAASSTMSEDTNPLFGSYSKPFTLEIDFKVSESAVEAPIIKYYDPSAANPDLYGLFIYPNKAIFKYQGGTSEVNYMKGERTALTYTICNKTVSDKDPNTGQTKTENLLFLFVYINGILSQMKPINNATFFPSQCGTIVFNCNNNDFDLYSFRGYNISLSSAQVLQNFISNIGNASLKERLYLNNAVYSDTESTGVQGEYAIDFNKVKGKIPCYVVVADSLPDTKDYLDCRGIYYEAEGYDKLTEWKNGLSLATTYYYTRKTPTSPWIRSKKIKFSGQGTSSLAYPRKNFKFKHNDKFYIKGHTSGKEKTFTFKADYMDSSGANNIGSAQILDDAIIRDRWIGTPVASNPNLRVNLDGFPIAMFWCKSTGGKGGVVQDEAATDVFDTDGLTPLYDSVRPNSENVLVGEVTPLNPVYIGTFNFNYDKKAKSLLGWDEDVFQGFEFRGNSSKANLYKGFENMCAMASTSEGFEWRWTFCSDYIDDYHDGNLSLTIDGGYFDEDVAQKYSEADYLANPEDIIDLVPYNQFYVIKDGIKCQLFHKVTPEEGETYYEPINYGSIDERNLGWSLVECEGISKPSSGICLEYGIKTAIKDGVESLVYQLPYGVSAAKPLGEAYPDGSHYYKFSWNPEHEFKFEYNDTQDYFTNIENWTTLYPLNEVFYLKTTYNQNDNGDYYFDDEEDGLGVKDGKYHLINNYPVELQNALLEDLEKRYDKTEEYINLTIEDEVKTFDFMREVFKNWCYVIEAVAHCDNDNWRSVFDSRLSWGDNGNGIFVYDSLTNYYCSSVFTGLCDNFAKNVFMHSYDGGRTWSPAWYDMDTAFGLNNEGAYTKMYDIDFLDLDNTGARAFNGSNSRIWQLLYNNAMPDLKSMYQTLRAQNYISYDNIIKRTVRDNISYKAASLYNANAVYRYMEPLAWHSNTKPEAAQGSREQLMKYWNYNRQTFMDSRYEGNGWTTDTVVLRLNNSVPVTFELVPDTNMFLGANFNSGQATVPSIKSPTKVQAGTMWSCSYGPSTNLNTYIYGASHLLQLGDLSLCNSTEYSLSNATNLTTIKIGDEVHPPIVTTRLNLSNNIPYKNLRTLDLTKTRLVDTNLSLVVGDDRHNLTPALETLKLAGSNIEYLTLAPFTPIVNLSLPSSIRKIELVNLLNLKNLTIEGYDNLENVEITNCPEVNQLAVLNGIYNSPNIDTIKLDNLWGEYEQAVTQDFMDRFMNLDSQGSQKVILSGSIFIQAISDDELNKYRNRWPNLHIELHQIFPEDVVLGVTNEGISDTLNRIKGATDKDAQYADDKADIVFSAFDQLEPYTSMQIVVDNIATPLFIEVDGYKVFNKAGYKQALSSVGNKFIRIPKFYTKYLTDSDGQVIGREISKYKIDNDYKYNPEFLRADGSERDYVDIGIYYSSDNIDSVAGVMPANKTRFEWSDAIRDKFREDTDFIYSTETIWTRQLLQDLFTVEFATTDSRKLFEGIATTVSTGTTDVLDNYLNGYQKEGTNTQVAFKYRGLENIWAAGGPVHIHGIQFLNNQAFVSTDPEKYGATEDLISTNLRIPNTSGVVGKLKLDKIDNNIQLTLQSVIHPYGAYKDLVFGAAGTGTRYAVVASAVDPYGLWFLNGDADENLEAMARLVRRPK